VGGKSRMPDYNGRITVQQLVDTVAFLQSRVQGRAPDGETRLLLILLPRCSPVISWFGYDQAPADFADHLARVCAVCLQHRISRVSPFCSSGDPARVPGTSAAGF
jgi:hypothetical protein